MPRIRAALALRLRRRTTGLRDGIHASTQSGRSMDFNDLRAYVVGDPVSDIDWRTSARHGSLLVRRHFAERRITLTLVVATGRDLAALAQPDVVKRDVALEAAGVFGVLATAHGDSVSVVWWDGTRARLERPTNRDVELEHRLAILHDACTPAAAPADLHELLRLAASSTRRRGIVAIICDTVDLDGPLLGLLRRLTAQHDVVMVTVGDLDPTVAGVAEHGVHAVGETDILEAAFLTDPVLAAEIARDRERRSRDLSAALAPLGIRHAGATRPSEALVEALSLVRRHSHARR